MKTKTLLKATIAKNKKFIQLNFSPDFNFRNGIRIYYKNEPDKRFAPFALCDLIKNKRRYYLTGLAPEAKKSIYRIEVFFEFYHVPMVIVK